MTQTSTLRPSTSSPTEPTFHYQVAMPNPQCHLFEITLHLDNWQADTLDLKMPVWTPGSYLVREYARHLQDFHVTSQGKPLPWQKISKNHWQIPTPKTSNLTITYRIFANELTVRTNHLDSTHGYFNGAALFLYSPAHLTHPLQVTIIPPDSCWHVSTALPPLPGGQNTFVAADFDTLVDSPFEIGTHKIHHFNALNKPHQWAIWGQNNLDVKKLIADTKKVIETEAEIYGGLPYDQYLFILHLTGNSFGGLEHKDSCSLIYSRFAFREPEKYNRFIQLVAHEFFHLWNVKRIRPDALETFDYDQENYTPSLWFCEGTTSYYDTLIPLWAGVYGEKTFLDLLSKDVNRFLNTPGRGVQPLSESSFDAWIKLYRRDSNSDNSQISYYLKGELVSLLLDLIIRRKYHNQRSFNDVLKQMWEEFGKAEIGYTPAQLKGVIESVAEMDLTDFFNRYIHGTEELPLNECLEPFGLQIKGIREKHPKPDLGVRVSSSNGTATIQFVEANSPAALAGIDAGDELLALDELRVTAEDLDSRLKDYRGGDYVKVTVFHQDELRHYSVCLGEPKPVSYQVTRVKSPTQEQQALLAGWLRISQED
ncbi:M61 family metallopeptidase [Spirulina subsalsa]|nr:M61 family metallopeptidase [Spirulina subsalsa]